MRCAVLLMLARAPAAGGDLPDRNHGGAADPFLALRRFGHVVPHPAGAGPPEHRLGARP